MNKEGMLRVESGQHAGDPDSASNSQKNVGQPDRTAAGDPYSFGVSVKAWEQVQPIKLYG